MKFKWELRDQFSDPYKALWDRPMWYGLGLEGTVDWIT